MRGVRITARLIQVGMEGDRRGTHQICSARCLWPRLKACSDIDATCGYHPGRGGGGDPSRHSHSTWPRLGPDSTSIGLLRLRHDRLEKGTGGALRSQL